MLAVILPGRRELLGSFCCHRRSQEILDACGLPKTKHTGISKIPKWLLKATFSSSALHYPCHWWEVGGLAPSLGPSWNCPSTCAHPVLSSSSWVMEQICQWWGPQEIISCYSRHTCTWMPMLQRWGVTRGQRPLLPGWVTGTQQQVMLTDQEAPRVQPICQLHLHWDHRRRWWKKTEGKVARDVLIVMTR